MKTITSPLEFTVLRNTLNNKTIGFVPTMGCLHDAHMQLLKKSIKENDVTVLSIFVNPTQFNNPNDLKNYPSTLDSDLSLAQSLGVDHVFMPTPDDMYPDQNNYKLTTSDSFSTVLEGAFRPGHFNGVLTVVMKLFNIIKPTRAYFGEKDFQQVTFVKRMTQAYFMDVDIITCPTVRLPSKLPHSSRNARLNDEQRQRADLFANILHNETDVERIKKSLTENNIRVEYVEKMDGRLFAAVNVDDIRLLDNIHI